MYDAAGALWPGSQIWMVVAGAAQRALEAGFVQVIDAGLLLEGVVRNM
jgi:hypothetical protein